MVVGIVGGFDRIPHAHHLDRYVEKAFAVLENGRAGEIARLVQLEAELGILDLGGNAAVRDQPAEAPRRVSAATEAQQEHLVFLALPVGVGKALAEKAISPQDFLVEPESVNAAADRLPHARAHAFFVVNSLSALEQ